MTKLHVENVVLTLEAISSLRSKAKAALDRGDMREFNEHMESILSLYASIDVDNVVEILKAAA